MFLLGGKLDITNDLESSETVVLKSFMWPILGTVQNLLYDMAGGEENFLQTIFSSRMQLCREYQASRDPFLKIISAPYS